MPTLRSIVPRRLIVGGLLPAIASATLASCSWLDLPRRGTTGGVLRAHPEVPVSGAPDALRVVTWNIERSKHVDLALEEIRSNPALDGADVYLFQEIDSDGARFLTASTGLAAAYYVASVRSRSGAELGNVVLSRWPIRDARRVDLPDPEGFSGTLRTATVVDLDVATRRVRVVSIHTATILVSPEEREAQWHAAVAALDDFAGPTVVGGDFNTLEDGDESALRAAFRVGGFRWVRQGVDSTVAVRWKRWLIPHDRIDHLFVRGLDLRGHGVVARTDASDHLPQWAVFTWDTP